MYRSTLSLTSALDGVGGQRHTLAALTPEKKPGIHFTGGWVGQREVWTGAENLASTGIRSPGRPACIVVSVATDYAGPAHSKP